MRLFLFGRDLRWVEERRLVSMRGARAYIHTMGRIFRAAPIVSALAVLAISGAGSLALPGSALAKPRGVAPPGNSGVSQYVEDLPTVEGSKPTHSVALAPAGSGGSGPGAHGDSQLSSTVARQLAHAGTAGKATAALAEATASATTTSGHATSGSRAAPATQVIKALGGSTGGGGLGGFLPGLLIAVLVVVSGIGILHRRRTT
jgi:hypothetical protein